ncbi:MAG: NAD(P)H-dependent oxidoreductase, partial [Alphaproteobacteria bacterium]|nr:NAD(P)H-dependent oxidoreductase [Alphaproteobacteria bacterium]
YAERLSKADGLAVISPEWSGMVPAGLKNFFLYCSDREIGHKPGLIVTVSATRGGSYPVDELRISSYKNTRLCYIPDHVIVRDVATVFEGAKPANKDDEYLRGRVDFALRELIAYAKAMKPMRESGTLVDKNYPYGM